MRMSELWTELKSSDNYFPPIDSSPKLELRDQFAIAALPALIQLHSIETVKEAAGAAYYIADAMLKAREEK